MQTFIQNSRIILRKKVSIPEDEKYSGAQLKIREKSRSENKLCSLTILRGSPFFSGKTKSQADIASTLLFRTFLLLCTSYQKTVKLLFKLKKYKTIRERHKSAPRLRFKISIRTSKCQVLSSTIPEKKPKGRPDRSVKKGSAKSILWQIITITEGETLLKS